MKRPLLSFLAAVAGVAAADGVVAQTPALNEGRLAETVERELTRYAASGAAVAIVARDSVLLLRGFGRTEHEGGAQVTPDVPFGTVALRDFITALAAATLAERGRVDLDAPIGAYAADLPPRVGAVTIGQLLSQTAGLDDARAEPRRRPTSAVWPEATDRALFTEPGAIHSRSRHSLPLARAILEARTGEPDSALVRTLVFDPLGMSRTTFDPQRAERLGAATGIVISTSGDRPLVGLEPTANPYAHVFATARDLASLLQQLLVADGDTAAPIPGAAFETVARARAGLPGSDADSVGLAVRIARTRGRRAITVASGEAGYGVLLSILPETGTGFVLLANATGAVLRASADVILDGLFGTEVAAAGPASPDAQLPDAPAAYAGTYANGDRFVLLEETADGLVWRDGDLALRIRRVGSRLEALIGDGRVAQTFHWTKDAAGRAYVIVEGVALLREATRTGIR